MTRRKKIIISLLLVLVIVIVSYLTKGRYWAVSTPPYSTDTVMLGQPVVVDHAGYSIVTLEGEVVEIKDQNIHLSKGITRYSTKFTEATVVKISTVDRVTGQSSMQVSAITELKAGDTVQIFEKVTPQGNYAESIFIKRQI